MFTINRKGDTRIVILTKNYAIKIPSITSWEFFLKGLLSNMEEWRWRNVAKDPNSYLCPSVLGTNTGLFVVMRRCKPVNNRGLYFVEFKRLLAISPTVTRISPDFYNRDPKPENFGYYNGKMVLLDYGS